MAGGQMQQSNPAAAVLYDHPGGGSMHNVGLASDAGDAVMARWLQSAGLQHLASPMASNTVPNLLMQMYLVLNVGISSLIKEKEVFDVDYVVDKSLWFPQNRGIEAQKLHQQGYGAQSAEEKQRLFKLMRNLNFTGESGSESYAPTLQNVPMDVFCSSEFRGDFGAGLLDLHSMDDTELLSEHVMSEPFEPSPFIPAFAKASDDNFIDEKQQREPSYGDSDPSVGLPTFEKETIAKESNVAKIKVVVRKRPLNKKELSRKEEDIVTVDENALTVHEPKVKVDLTAYVERHEFCFDAVLDEHVTNDEVYRVTIEPIVPSIFQRTKATCFAYGQTGSGKTFTMKPLPLRAADDLVRWLHQPVYRSQRFKLWLSYFEIYGGKLFDLLCDRKKLCMREDGRQQVCIVGLQEFEVSDVQIVKEYIEKGNATRSTGSTGANEESSRSHAILQLVVKKHSEVKDTRRNMDGNEAKSGKVVGKISFIDLAGSERGADTTDNDRQTRIEGAEINKSLLALKECIRALDNDQIHIPFRGSKLTEVLRDSFVGNSRTVMISCISPNAGSCEHTLNTLRYADRVKSLSKSGNGKKDSASSTLPLVNKEASFLASLPLNADMEDVQDQFLEARATDTSKRVADKENTFYNRTADHDRQPTNLPSTKAVNGLDVSSTASGSIDKEAAETRTTFGGSSTGQSMYSSFVQNSADVEEKMQKVSPPRRKVSSRDERTEKLGNWLKKEGGGSDPPTTSYKIQSTSNAATTANHISRQYEPEPSLHDGNIDALLEEEEALITAHRKEIEDTMEIVREEMKLLAEVDQPGSLIDNYVTQLSFVLSRKAAGLVSLQARLARFQHRLKEQEILTRRRVPN